jgi:hypothetical protein
VLNGRATLGRPVTEAVGQVCPGKGEPQPSSDWRNRGTPRAERGPPRGREPGRSGAGTHATSSAPTPASTRLTGLEAGTPSSRTPCR